MMQVKLLLLQWIGCVIMMNAAHVEGIQNAGRQDNYGSSSGQDSTSSVSVSPPSTPSAADASATARESTSFRPPQLLAFTSSDASFSSFGNTPQPGYSETGETRHSPNARFAFPSKQQSAAATPSDTYQPTSLSSQNAISAQLQSTPTLTYLDPYTQQHTRYTPLPPSSSVQEYTVHSTMLVQNQRYEPHTATSQHQTPPPQPPPPSPARAPPPSQAARPYFTPQASEFLHKYDASHPLHPQHPNSIPTYERPANPRAPPPYLSYASKDYPSPTYFQPFNRLPPPPQPPAPQRQDFSAAASSIASNYVNNDLDDYLHGAHYKPQQQHKQHQNYYPQPLPSSHGVSHYTPTRPSYEQSSRPKQPPAYNTYFPDYQQGEVPPSHLQSVRPPPSSFSRPTPQSPQQTSGLASLASLFSATQQYAPQFPNLGSLLGTFSSASPARPMNAQLVRALENIARNDDLQCVPKVLCQLIASQTQRGQLPAIMTSPALTNFLAAFPASSPALIYGRAALLGVSGGVSSCVQTYAKCPKREDEILYYLNNYRGGFFKFFNEPEPEPQNSPQPSSVSTSSSSSLLNVLSLLTGNPSPTTTTPRPKPRPTPASQDTGITSGIGNFFANVLSQYVGGVEHQRRRRRSRRSLAAGDDGGKFIEAINRPEAKEKEIYDDENGRGIATNWTDDEYDDDDVDVDEIQYNGAESRIINKDFTALSATGPTFFPRNERLAEIATKPKDTFFTLHSEKKRRQLKFPRTSAPRKSEHLEDIRNSLNEEQTATSPHEKVRFQDVEEDQHAAHTNLGTIVVSDPKRGVRMVYTGNIDDLLRKGRIVNRPSAVNHHGFVRNLDFHDKLVVSNARRKPLHTQNASNIYNNHDFRSPSNSYTANNHYSSSSDDAGQAYKATRRPHEDDRNIYVTNAKGENEYYVTPDGKKVYF